MIQDGLEYGWVEVSVAGVPVQAASLLDGSEHLAGSHVRLYGAKQFSFDV